jgi:hypothetical protein
MRAFLLLQVALAAALTACASGGPVSDASPEPTRVAARDALVAKVRECTRTHGYDPRVESGVAESALAPNELPWRQCTYDALRAYGRSNPPLRSLYEQLIAEDISMTTAIQQGSLTRSQRRARIEALLAQIDQAEADQVLLAEFERERQAEQKQFLVESLRSLR